MSFIIPQWPAPANVKSLLTSRAGGVSQAPYQSFNLANHVGDSSSAVTANRQVLQDKIGLPVNWVKQVHGCDIATLSDIVQLTSHRDSNLVCDGITSRKPGIVCAVLTADCLPLLICDRNGDQVAAVHAGWRGLAGGIISAAVNAFTAPPADLLVYLGPAISCSHFEVGPEVLAAFTLAQAKLDYAEPATLAFTPITERGIHTKKYLADLYRLARAELNGLGITQVFGGHYCTYAENDRFFSYRRDGITGRMASLIWRNE